MTLTQIHYEQIKDCFPLHRRAADISNLEVLNAILYVLENGCKWRALPNQFGNWHTIYTRMSRWIKNGILQKAFLLLQEKGIIMINVNVVFLDSTSVKVHPDGMGALKKPENNPLASLKADGTLKFIWSPHLTGM